VNDFYRGARTSRDQLVHRWDRSSYAGARAFGDRLVLAGWRWAGVRASDGSRRARDAQRDTTVGSTNCCGHFFLCPGARGGCHYLRSPSRASASLPFVLLQMPPTHPNSGPLPRFLQCHCSRLLQRFPSSMHSVSRISLRIVSSLAPPPVPSCDIDGSFGLRGYLRTTCVPQAMFSLHEDGVLTGDV
jgi:hypothetical protein